MWVCCTACGRTARLCGRTAEPCGRTADTPRGERRHSAAQHSAAQHIPDTRAQASQRRPGKQQQHGQRRQHVSRQDSAPASRLRSVWQPCRQTGSAAAAELAPRQQHAPAGWGEARREGHACWCWWCQQCKQSTICMPPLPLPPHCSEPAVPARPWQAAQAGAHLRPAGRGEQH